MPARLRIGVLPSAEHARRGRLWSALEQAYAVSFEGRAAEALGELDAVVALRSDAAGQVTRTGLPGLIAHGEETPARRGAIELARSPVLACPLRGARLSEAHAVTLPHDLPQATAGEVLATLDGAPAWTLPGEPAAALHHVGCAPAELDEGEALRERLQPGRCLALLALVQFLRNLVAGAQASDDLGAASGTDCDPGAAPRPTGAAPRPTGAVPRPTGDPPLRAAFVIDDPNLHRPRYGHLRYAELLRDARAHGYHLSIAMVPLDAWFADPRVARMFREGAERLSVCVHGNNHEGPELSRPDTPEAGVSLARQALRRIAAFERRTAVAVDRVMVPPHEQISEPMARALVACGFQGLCTTRPYPWLATTPQMSWLVRPPEAGPLAGWRPADVVAGGLPVLLRADFALHPREDLVLRAFLGQPLILYGHHELLRGGPAALAAAAAQIDALGEVRWESLGQIARGLARGSLSESVTGSESESAALAAIPSPPRRLRPVVRRLAAESEVRLRALAARVSTPSS